MAIKNDSELEESREELERKTKFNEDNEMREEANIADEAATQEKAEINQEAKEAKQEPKVAREPIFFVDAYGNAKYVYGQEEYERVMEEKDEIITKRRNKKIGAITIGVILLGLIGTAGFSWYKYQKTAQESLSIETEVETATEEDLNIPVKDAIKDSPKTVEEIMGNENIMAGGDPTTEVASKEGIQESLTSSAEQVAESDITIESTAKVKESEASNPTGSTTATETLPASTEGQIEIPTTLSQGEIDKDISEGQAAQAETMEPEEYDGIEDYGKWLAESMANDPEYQKDIREHQNND